MRRRKSRTAVDQPAAPWAGRDNTPESDHKTRA